jgi:nucleoside 2-deoxyribosyltransferase
MVRPEIHTKKGVSPPMSSEKLKVYLAGPIAGQTGEKLLNSIAEKVAILTDIGYITYQPMVGKSHIIPVKEEYKANGYDQFPLATNHAIFARDKWMVSQADIILADLSSSGSRVSIGTMMEIAWANLQGKMVIVVLPDGNVHDHLFVREAATHVFKDMDQVYAYLKELALSRVTWEMI